MGLLEQASQMARDGFGWENLKVKLGITEAQARYAVFGREAYMRWKAKQEKMAS